MCQKVHKFCQNLNGKKMTYLIKYILHYSTVQYSTVQYRIAEWLEAQPLAQWVWGWIPLFGQMLKVENLSESERT